MSTLAEYLLVICSFVCCYSKHTELVKSKNEKRLVNLESQNLRRNQGKRLSIDSDKAFSGFCVCDGYIGALVW
jgi:hypothetical protein